MYKNRFRGFTLIELLVVIAIIGILSAVVLAALNTARQKGNDAAIESDLSTVRNEAEIYYGGGNGNPTPNTYGTQTFAAGTACLPTLVANTSNMFFDPVIQNALKGVLSNLGSPASGGVACEANGTSYAAAGQLVATPGTWWCVDSTGVSKLEPGGAANPFPTASTGFPNGACP